MDIECILKREGGSKIDIDGTTYHFKPIADGAHVAAVEDKTHRNRFLSISEGYQIYDGAVATPPVKTAPVEPGAVVLYVSSNFPATFDINGKQYALGDIVAQAQAISGKTPEEWNELLDDDRDALIDAELDAVNEATAGNAQGNSELDAAKEAYKLKFGRLPHYRWSVEKINEELAK